MQTATMISGVVWWVTLFVIAISPTVKGQVDPDPALGQVDPPPPCTVTDGDHSHIILRIVESEGRQISQVGRTYINLTSTWQCYSAVNEIVKRLGGSNNF